MSKTNEVTFQKAGIETSNNHYLKQIRKKYVSRIAKAVLYHLDGTESEIKLILPIFTMSGDPEELGNTFMSEWIKALTRSFISLSHFQVHLGSIDFAGNETYTTYYQPFYIPVDKVYVMPDTIKGKWLTIDETKDAHITKIPLSNN